jgi:hypothetical protein
MSKDPRYCSVCRKLLLKQDEMGFVLLTSCDFCSEIIHEACYFEHHRKKHDLIAVIIEEPNIQPETYSFE